MAAFRSPPNPGLISAAGRVIYSQISKLPTHRGRNPTGKLAGSLQAAENFPFNPNNSEICRLGDKLK